MDKLREILRLSELGLSQRQIGKSVNLGKSTIQQYQKRLSSTGYDFKELLKFEEDKLLELIRGKRGEIRGNRPGLDYEYIFKELKRLGVTLQLLWEEYCQNNDRGYGYSMFCHKYNDWLKKQDLSYRFQYKAGEKASVDYTGDKLSFHDTSLNTSVEVEIFVLCLHASNKIYAEATLTQSSTDWLSSHKRAFEYLGGTPQVVIPDNLKSGVTKACYHEPGINKAYQEFADHYGIAIIPTRVRKPKDKGKVESSVLCVERRILAQLRDTKFFSLSEINNKIRELLEELNNQKMSGYGCSRNELFEKIEKSELKPLPLTSYTPKEVKQAKVHPDYHISYKKKFYSVPCEFRGEYVEVHSTDKTIEIYHKGKRIASPPNKFVKYSLYYRTKPYA